MRCPRLRLGDSTSREPVAFFVPRQPNFKVKLPWSVPDQCDAANFVHTFMELIADLSSLELSNLHVSGLLRKPCEEHALCTVMMRGL